MVLRAESENASRSHGGLHPADAGSIRAIWSIQDRIALDADEEKAVEVKREMIAGQERVV
jgi:hypothetical protein